MPMNINILDTYYMMGLWKGLSPVTTFFRDRYFPTAPSDIYASDKVLVEYQDGDTGMAPFMVERADPINVSRQGYEIHDYAPTCIKQSRNLTVDDLKKRGFGEAILSDSNEAERAAKLVSEDLALLERRFTRTEELLCAQTMINNGFTVNEMLDANTVGNVATVQYYDAVKGNDGLYTINSSYKWSADCGWDRIVGDVRAMCRGLSRRNLPAVDMLIGQDVSDVLLKNTDFRSLVNRDSGLLIASPISQELTKYEGVSLLGIINFGGYKLNVICVDEQYKNGDNWENYFPAKSVMVTAPACGHLMYAHIVHMDEAGNVETIKGKRVPDLFVDRRKKVRELILESRPLAAPKNYAPWVYAANAVA